MASNKMFPKLVVIPGSATAEEKDLLGGKVLGVGYYVDRDVIDFNLITAAQVVDTRNRWRKVFLRWTRRK